MRILLLSLIVSVSGCFCADTCSPGTTFETVTLVGEPAADGGVIAFTFTRGTAKLPDSYYAAATPAPLTSLSEAADGGWVEPTKATFTAPDRFEVTLPRPVGEAVNFRLQLPDRRGFLQCSHPGANDGYHLDVTFDRAATPSFGWKQSVRLGPI